MPNDIQLDEVFYVSPSFNDKGEEVVLFDEELVKEGSEKWKFTICGYFVGCKMGVNELRYNIRRMWGRFGLKDIVVDEGICYFKFRHEDGINSVIDQSPWLVNGKPLIVQKWDADTTIVKETPCKIPIWIRLSNIPLEAWNVKGISTIASRLGRPIKMDRMTAMMCKDGSGRLGFARVLVEINAEKEYIENIKINYIDDLKNVKKTKWVKAEYSWMPDRCKHCCVFGHSFQYCKLKPRVEIPKNGNKQNNQVDKEGFVEVRSRKNIGGQRDMGNRGATGAKQNFRQNMGPRNNNVKFTYKPIVPENAEKNNEPVHQEKKGGEQSPTRPKKIWNVGKENVYEIRKSANKYAVLTDRDNDESQVDPFLDKRRIVDEFIKKKIQPSCVETKDWNYDMIQYFKYKWAAKERMENENSDDEDVFENHNQAVNSLIADEVLGNGDGGGNSNDQ
ncbi:RNA-directed DNA polymerase, eukaryota, reverse transcriptase zinc-binding domain protein [Tanacetum coccineum]